MAILTIREEKAPSLWNAENISLETWGTGVRFKQSL